MEAAKTTQILNVTKITVYTETNNIDRKSF